MMRSDDLAPLLGPEPGDSSAVRFGQGVVIAWNTATGENTIRFRGTDLANLPIIASSAEVLLIQPGDVVGLQVIGDRGTTQIYIVGRITLPGTSQAVQALRLVSDRIVVAEDPDDGGRTGTVPSGYQWGDLTGSNVGPAVTVNVGSSGKALVFWCCEIERGAPVNEGSGAWASVQVSGATNIAPSNLYAVGYSVNPTNESERWAAGRHKLFTGLNPGLNTFTMKYAVFPINVSATVTCTFLEREIAVFAL